MRLNLIMGVLLFFVSLNSVAGAEETAPLTLVRTIPLPGVEGRIDHMSIDHTAHRLYVAALGNNTLELIDLIAGKRVAQITGLAEPQGDCALPENGSVVVASGEDGKCRFYDKNQKLLATIDGLDD